MHPHSDARPSAFCTSHDAVAAAMLTHTSFKSIHTVMRVARLCASHDAVAATVLTPAPPLSFLSCLCRRCDTILTCQLTGRVVAGCCESSCRGRVFFLRVLCNWRVEHAPKRTEVVAVDLRGRCAPASDGFRRCIEGTLHLQRVWIPDGESFRIHFARKMCAP